MKKNLILLALLTLATAALSQEMKPYDGSWKAEYTAKNGTSREGKVTIANGAGTWDMAVQARNNPCLGRAYPITVTVATANELTFQINRAATLPGCKDGTASLKRVDEKTLEGEFDSTKLRLVRE